MNDNANVNGHEPATGADEETPNGNTASSTSGAAEKWGGSVMDVQCAAMRFALNRSKNAFLCFCWYSRDRLAFSKSILRRFLRDSVDREAAVASPWTVKPAVAVKYGIESEMPDDKKKDVESVRKGEMQKRKKVSEQRRTL
jgi:bromodomain adjacent to zinc finger domain protein 1A